MGILFLWNMDSTSLRKQGTWITIILFVRHFWFWSAIASLSFLVSSFLWVYRAGLKKLPSMGTDQRKLITGWIICCSWCSCLVHLPRPYYWSQIQVYRSLPRYPRFFNMSGDFEVQNWAHSQRVNVPEEFVTPPVDLEHALWKLVWCCDGSRVGL